MNSMETTTKSPAGWNTSDYWASEASQRRLRRRYAADWRLQVYGLAAITFAVLLLGILVTSLASTGYKAFVTSKVDLPVFVDSALIDTQDIPNGNFRAITRNSFGALFPEVTNRRDISRLNNLLTSNAPYIIRDYIIDHPETIGSTVKLSIALSDPFDQLHKQVMPAYLDAAPQDDVSRQVNPRFGSEKEIGWYNQLVDKGLVHSRFASELFLNADSRFPEQAGLAGAIAGSFFALLVCFLLSFPIGIAAAVYLEEVAPKNRITDLIEVNINNLAAVPSVVFGLLGLAVFLGTFGLPRSAPLVGGMVLSLMTLPTIIITTRAALKAVPPSIREAALGVGASKYQVILHHVLPLAMPGILTGTIIGLAQALGETAPLLLIGMNAFIPSVENIGMLEPATALPTQIFSWADSPERGFVARTSAAILVLLGFLVIMNALAVVLRQKFERKW